MLVKGALQEGKLCLGEETVVELLPNGINDLNLINAMVDVPWESVDSNSNWGQLNLWSLFDYFNDSFTCESY